MEAYTPLHNNAYEHLIAGILHSRFQPGKFYSETRLAKEIGLSRTPVRVALQQLQRGGLIEIVPNKGFIVRKMSLEDVIATYQIRAAIEGYAATQLAKDRSAKGKKELKKLEELHEKQKRQLKKTFNLDKFTDIDEKFHETLVDYLENTSLTELFFNQLYKIHAICINTFHIQNRPSQALLEHEAILNALRSGSPGDAYAAILQHLENVEKLMIKLLEA